MGSTIMKKLIAYITFALYSASALAGLPPTSLKGQSDTSASTKFGVQVPYNQYTDLGGVNGLLETGNNNLLPNPSFEHTTFSTGWTTTTAAAAVETTDVVDGKKSMKLTFTASTGDTKQSVTPAVVTDGVNLEYSAWVKTSLSGIQVCALQAGSEVGTCADVPSNGKWVQVRVNYPGVSSGSVGVKVKASSSVTGTVYVDDAYVGKARNVGTTAQAQFVGSSFFPQTASCQWDRTSGTLGDFTTSTACPGPTIEKQVIGSWQTTDTDLPQQTINNLPPGIYKVEVIAGVSTASTTYGTVTISDGTTTSGTSAAYPAAGNIESFSLVGYFEYSTAGNRTFKIQGAAQTGAVSIFNSSSNGMGPRFVITRFPLASETAVRMDQSNTDWNTFTMTPGGTTSAPTKASSPVLDSAKWRREGPDMLIQWDYRQTANTGSAAGSGTYLFPIPSGYTIDTTKVSASTTITNGGYNSPSTTVGFGTEFDTTNTLNGIRVKVYDSTRLYLAVHYEGSTSGASTIGSTAPGDFNQSAVVTISFTARVPIAGWTANQNAPLLVGGVTSSSAGLERVERASVVTSTCSGSPCTITSQSGFVSSITRSATGAYTVNFNAGVFSAAPVCQAIIENNTAGIVYGFTAPTTSAWVIRTLTSAGVAADAQFNLQCVGPR